MFRPRMLRKTKQTFGKKHSNLKKEQGSANSFSQDSVINSSGELKNSREEKVTFTTYFHCYKEFFQKDCTTWSEEKKIHLLLVKFSQSEHEQYANYILPRNHGEILFEETV